MEDQEFIKVKPEGLIRLAIWSTAVLAGVLVLWHVATEDKKTETATTETKTEAKPAAETKTEAKPAAEKK